jgi:hypothetical protein
VVDISVFVFGEISLYGEETRKPVLIVQGISWGGKNWILRNFFHMSP